MRRAETPQSDRFVTGTLADKRCPSCCAPGETLPASAFYPNRARPGGLSSQCRQCHRATDSRSYYRHRGEIIPKKTARRRRVMAQTRSEVLEYLAGHPCSCGESNPIVLEFHHEDPHKEAEVGDLIAAGYIWPTVYVEIQKCVVLCVRCHRLKTAEERGYWKTRIARDNR